MREDSWSGAETFLITPAIDDLLIESKVPFVTHCSISSEFTQRCHNLGIRCFPYTTFYLGSDSVQWGTTVVNVYQGAAFGSHKFYEIDNHGDPKRSQFGSMIANEGGIQLNNCYITCPNEPEYHRKMIEWVKHVVDLGADGIFLDNVFQREPCYGARYGIHAHMFPDPSDSMDASAQNQAYAALLRSVREVIKKSKPDGRILGNSGNPLNVPLEFQRYIDSDMIEAYVCAGGPTGGRTVYWSGNITWDQLGRNLQSYLANGKQMLVSSYINFCPALGVEAGIEDAALCYAQARLAGFIWTCQPAPTLQVNPVFRRLFAVRLGDARTVELTDPTTGILYRVFECGLVAVNPDTGADHTLTHPAATDARIFVDVLTNATVTTLEVPKDSGRIFLFGATPDYGVGWVAP